MLQPPMPQVPQCHSERRKGAHKSLLYKPTAALCGLAPQLGPRQFERGYSPPTAALVRSLRDTGEASHGLNLRRLSIAGHVLHNSGGRSAKNGYASIVYVHERAPDHASN